MAVNLSTVGYAYDIHEKLIQLAPVPINASRAPTAADMAQLNQLWNFNGNVYMLTAVNNGASVWVEITGGAVIFVDLTVTGHTILQGQVDMTGTPINISNNAVAAVVHLADGAAVKTLTMGSDVGASATTINAGTGNLSIIPAGPADVSILGNATTGTFTVGNAASGAIDFTTSAGFSVTAATASNITLSAAAAGLTLQSTLGTAHIVGGQAINNAVTISASDAAGGIALDAGTGGVDFAIVNGPFTVATGTGQVDISSDATANTVNIATGNGVKALNLGSTNTTSSTIISSGSNGISLRGGTGGLLGSSSNTVTSAAGVPTVTLDVNVGRAVFNGFVTAMGGGQQALTINCNKAGINSTILATAMNDGANGMMGIVKVARAAGSFVVTVQNFDAANNLDNDIIISFWVMD